MTHLKLLCICWLTVFFCLNNYEAEVDSRLEFIGAYKISKTEVKYTEGGRVIPSQPINIDTKIKFQLDNTLNDDELLVDMEDYIEDLYREYYLVLGVLLGTVEVDIDNDIIAKISGNDFEINNVEFEVTIAALDGGEEFIIGNEMDVKGEFNGSTLKFDFEINLTRDGQGNFEGDSIGEKD